MEIMGTVRQEPIVAKKIYLHRNGLHATQPKMIVVNERHIRDFNVFLTRVTSGIKAPIAVRNIYTPIGGSRVQKLDQLESGKHYVAGGNEHFKKMRYDRHLINFQRRTQKQPLINKDLKIEPPVRIIKAISRFRNVPEKPYLIHVFRNGDALFKGVRVLLPRRLMNSWEHVLELITDKVELILPAKRLCTLEGQVIHAVTDIKDGEKYVALEGARRFIKLPYCGIDPIPKLSSNRKHQIRSHRTTSTILSTETTLIQTSLQEDQPKIKRLMPIKQHKGVVRPFAGRKNKAARNRALRDAQTDSAFGTAGQSTIINTSIISEGSINDNVLEDTHNLSTTMDTSNDSVQESETIQTNNNDNNGAGEESVVVNEEEVVEEVVEEIEDKDINRETEEEAEKKDTVIEEHVIETTEVVNDGLVPTNEDNDNNDQPTMILDNNGITELQGKNLNESVDLSLARKDQEPNTSTTVVTTVASSHSSSKHSNSKLNSKSNTPMNSSKTSLVAKSKTSLAAKSKSSMKSSSRSTSKHSTRMSTGEPQTLVVDNDEEKATGE